jgi:2-polyprenyl-6-methoxyphenol hydroxylase-like FAD-dependent oxidoreductase
MQPTTTPGPRRPTTTAAPDVLIVGAGPAGLALSTALAQAGLRSTVLEQALRRRLAAPPEDGRDIALTHRARRILETLGALAAPAGRRDCPAAQGRREQRRSPWCCPSTRKATATMRWAGWCPTTACARPPTPPQQQHAGRDACCATHGSPASAATGRQPGHAAGGRQPGPDRTAGGGRRQPLFHPAPHGRHRRHMLDFGRTAIVCRVSHEAPTTRSPWSASATATRWPMLPMAGRTASAVLTLPSDQAGDWLALDDAAFSTPRAGRSFGDAWAACIRRAAPQLPAGGCMPTASPRRAFALVGDAAVGMHPVTAHGYNFGLYGVQVLARELARRTPAGRGPGLAARPAAYESRTPPHHAADLPGHQCRGAAVHRRPGPGALLRGAVLRAARRLPPLQLTPW